MPHFVYILECQDGEYYSGITNNLKKRLSEHNDGLCHSTAYRRPTKLIFYCAVQTKRSAARFEQYLKSHSGRRFRDRFLVEFTRRSEAETR